MTVKKPSISPTKISIYLACPVKYRWTYIDAKGRWYLKAKNYYSFGSSLHKVLQRFHDQGDIGVQTTSQALAALEESWIEAGYSSAQEMQEALGEGKNILEAYIAHYQALPTTAKTIFVEKLFKLDMGDYFLIGRIDRVDEHEDGTIEVVDYKSGRIGVTQEEVATDLAMSCYQLLLKSKYPNQKVTATIIALRNNEKATASLNKDELKHFQEDLITICKEILNRDYDQITPAWKDICSECDFLPLCKKHPDFNSPEPTE